MWDGEPPRDDNSDGALAFAVFALTMAAVVIAGQLVRWLG